MRLPIDPMAPIRCEELPVGPDWGYQLKWDGIRIIAELSDGRVTLYSRNGLVKNAMYPELVDILSQVSGNLVLDGEAVVIDPRKGRPSFQLVLKRERSRGRSREASRTPVTYALFDLLEKDNEDLRGLPYSSRYDRLKERFPHNEEQLLVTDMFPDGQLLWQWVEASGWEGVVAKRLSSPYRIGKRHSDWYKKKTALNEQVDIIGYTIKEGRLASLVMMQDGVYTGRVSSGLNGILRSEIAALPANDESLLSAPHSDLKAIETVWLKQPFTAIISAAERTDDGLFRQPKIIHLELRRE